jgi:hypothetical protein
MTPDISVKPQFRLGFGILVRNRRIEIYAALNNSEFLQGIVLVENKGNKSTRELANRSTPNLV